MEERIKFIKDDQTKMANRRKQIEQLYGGSDTGIQRLFDRLSSKNIGGRYNELQINRIMQQVGTPTLDKGEVLDLTDFAYATDPNYANIIDYLSNMFMWRYYFFPVEKSGEVKTDEEYAEIYDLMLEVIDGLNIEVTFPTIITKLIKDGEVYLYTTRNTSSKTISTILLNPQYCAPIMMSQYGTGLFQFDLKYFTDLGLRGEQLEEALEFFPKDIVAAYKAYQSSKDESERKIILDGKHSTYIALNDFGFATKLGVLNSLFDYNKYRANEVERSNTQLDRVMTHRIPSYDGRLLFELPEVRALHKSMSRSLGNSARTKFITTFGEVDIHPLMEQDKMSNDTLQRGQENVYRSAGLNADLFSGKTKDSLQASLTKDQAIIWKYVQQLVNFYNLTINNLFNFKGSEAEITMLPITHYNLNSMMEIHRRNAEYGIGRLEAVIASGTKQKHISPKSRLEEFLKLDEVLKPLASSHTQSQKKESESDKKEEKPTKEVKKDIQEDDEEDEEE